MTIRNVRMVQKAIIPALLAGCFAYSISAMAFVWPWNRHRLRVATSPQTPGYVPGPELSGNTICEGMDQLPSRLVKRQGGFFYQNLTHRGMSLAGVPTAYQGRRLSFGSCSMAAALTQFNGYVKTHGVLLAENANPPFYRLGTITPRRRALIFRTVGEADLAVENTFDECHARYSASAQGMADCLAEKITHATCLTPDLRYAPCPAPRVVTQDGDVAHRRALLRAHFSQADPSQIVPVTFPWDTRMVLGPAQTSASDVDLEHVSAMIGRRLTPSGRCEVLIRNSWGTCSRLQQRYPLGSCDHPGYTDDVWVDGEAFLRRSGELTFLR